MTYFIDIAALASLSYICCGVAYSILRIAFGEEEKYYAPEVFDWILLWPAYMMDATQRD